MIRLLDTLMDCAVLCALAAVLGLGLAALALPEDDAHVQRAARVRLAVWGAP